MRKKSLQLFGGIASVAMLVGVLNPFPAQAAVEFGWEVVNGNSYWYENGIKQGTEGRGKEIFDPGTNAWYWLDSIDGGKMATSKDLYQESKADDAGNMGKWVRYDENGHMVKGWDTNENGTYYFDLIYGTMAKGYHVIDGKLYYFDKETGVGSGNETSWDHIDGWVFMNGNQYWYEDGVRQGTTGRGKEIFDPDSDAWYWLDSVDEGKKAVSKDLYQESLAGDWAENEDGTGKWVRYDSAGHMIKGWNTNENGTYYFDLTYGTMAKGIVSIDGKRYEFDSVSGILINDNPSVEPTAAPTAEPTTAPTAAPTAEPTAAPTTAPTAAPTAKPTTAPTAAPTAEPTTAPTTAPTAAPTTEPTAAPTTEPTTAPTTAPTAAPTTEPTTAPTTAPTAAPSTQPEPTPPSFSGGTSGSGSLVGRILQFLHIAE